ncbi:hypothetical protein BUALT_Bualt02G0201900 [Buddleja alternifolia]|uniref:WRC domain-containing protein n=1 Tax=Buddleja alternifolia TaxID=168488 RepID=A0AAV6YAF3_9LAMI|nr:hypothetical protein BUALT_Bualt02G0201900 [Buddleja alternifolia]
MRIRKHAKFSALLYAASSSTIPEPHVDRDDVFAGNGSSNQSISVVQREYSGRVVAATDKAKQPESDGVILCSKTDGKSWQCKREAAKGNSLCEHHLSLAKNYNNNNVANSTTKTKPEKPTVLESRPRPERKKASKSSDPHQYYYYSGFGPRWGKRRGETSKNNGFGRPEHEHELDPALLSRIMDEEFDYTEDEDESEESRKKGKKRARKLIKARSLKSLM